MKTQIQNLFIALALLAGIHQAAAQGTTAFTYQGQLRDNGTNANGTYTMIFNLYDSSSGGNLIGGPITTTATMANGLFTVNLDFGASAFNGSARYLDITVTNGGATQELSPRVQVSPSPYALYAAVAATVTNGAIMNAQLAANAVNASNIAGGQVVKSLDGLSDAVSMAAGTGVTITTNGNALQISASGGGGGISLAAGNNVGFLTNNGITQISSFVPNIQIYSTPSTNQFTVPTNVTKVMVEVWGGGGGGGDGNISGNIGGGGGGAGGYGKGTFSVIPGNSYTVIVGSGGGPDSPGGASSFDSLMSANGGAAGNSDGTGGTGGSSGADLNITGGSGGSLGTDYNYGGAGGSAGCGGSGGGEDLGAGSESGQVPGGGGGGGGLIYTDDGEQADLGASGGGGRVVVYY